MKLTELNFTNGKTKQIIFLVLLSAVLIVFLLSDTQTFQLILSQWYKKVSISCTKEEFDFTNSSQQLHMTRYGPDSQRCSYNYLSPENLQEGRRLLDSITWPQIPPLPNGFSLSLTTSGPKSSFSVVPRSEGWRVGDELTVRIQLRDFNGNPKKSGGDFIVSRLHNRQLGAGVVGQVQDHLNGTFTAVFPLLWDGTADVEVLLVQTSESITVLKRLREKEPDRFTFYTEFKSGRVTERSTCNVCLNPDNGPLCNFTDLNTGEQWFCYKPKTLDCNTRVIHSKGNNNQPVTKQERTLFQGGINMKVYIKASEQSTVTILPKAGDTKKMSLFEPAGYYYGYEWRPLNGQTVRKFNDASAITACLKGKRLHMFGDSTIRQYYMYIGGKQPNLLKFDQRSSFQCGPFLAVDHTNDIMMTHRCHGPPICSNPLLWSQLKYVANELDRLNGGSGTVVVIGLWAHFTSFTVEVYYQRLMTIVKAVKRLLNRAPETKVIVRTATLREINSYNHLTNNDWYALQLNKVLRAVFKDTGVFMLEAWDMVQAYHLPHDVHPREEIVKLMVDQILSLTCP